MDLTKLFETQKVLRDRIGYNEPDRFNKLILALLVELGECANEWRGFKFWSKDQEPRNVVKRKCPKCNGCGYIEGLEIVLCDECDNPWGGMKTVNPLLEEYVDGFHIVLEFGLIVNYSRSPEYGPTEDTIEEQFNEIFCDVSAFRKFHKMYGVGCGLYDMYEELLGKYISLAEMLGFTWDQIEQAYFEKNKENHARQDRGY